MKPTADIIKICVSYKIQFLHLYSLFFKPRKLCNHWIFATLGTKAFIRIRKKLINSWQSKDYKNGCLLLKEFKFSPFEMENSALRLCFSSEDTHTAVTKNVYISESF